MRTQNIIKLITLGLLAIIIPTILLGGFTCVPFGNCGIVIRMGKIQDDIRTEGFNWKIPWIDTITPISIQQQTDTTTFETYSSDLQPVRIAITTLWRRPAPRTNTLYRDYREYTTVINKQEVHITHYSILIQPKLSECLKALTAKMSAEQLVKNRTQIKTELIKTLKETLGDILIIDDVALVNIDLSDVLEKAIEQKMVMEQESLKKQFELERAKKDNEIKIAVADAEAKAKILGAEAEAKSISLVGDALAKTPRMIELEMVKKWNGIMPITMTGNSSSLLIPIGQDKK